MPDQDRPALLEELDVLVSEYLAAAASADSQTLVGGEVDVDEFVEHGAYPPTDPRSKSSAALLAIASRLNAEGGSFQLANTLEAYREKYGAKRGVTLNARWQYWAEQ